MNTKIRNSKLMAVVLILCLAISSLSGCSLLQLKKDDQTAFNDYLEDSLVNGLGSDYMSVHQLFLHPEDYGIDLSKIEISCGSRFSKEDIKAAREGAKEELETLRSFDRSKLTPDQQDLYDSFLFTAEINEKLSDKKFDYYSSLFSPMQGLHNALAQIFADWELRNEQDVKDLITLMDDILPYTESALDYTETQAKKGLLVNSLESVVEYCQNIVDKGTDSSILEALLIEVDDLNLTNGEKYKKQIVDRYETSYLPAFETMVERLSKLVGKEVKGGLCELPYGKEYYELLMQENLGYDISPDDFMDKMQDVYDSYVDKLMEVAQRNYDAIDAIYSGNLVTDFTSYQEILEYIEGHLSENFPEVPKLEYTIGEMNEEVASDAGIAAYFLIPSVDGNDVQRMKVNPAYGEMNSLDTYGTVSHEGFPGHMFQYAYLYDKAPSVYAKLLTDNGGYTEGYAVYAQYEGLHYLVDDGIITEDEYQAYKYNELAAYMLINAGDIGVNYYGWSQKDFRKFFKDAGFDLGEEFAKEEFNQLRCDPCAFFPYYGGLQKILEMKEIAMEQMGSRFTEQGFNNALLSSGPVPFSVVEHHIEDYINGNSGK